MLTKNLAYGVLLTFTLPVFGGNPASSPAVESIKGTTRCSADLNLALPITGRVAEVLVKEGALVKSGQVLLRLDYAAEKLEMERRKIQWQNKSELKTAEARKATAEAQLQAARNVYQSSQGISREELENRELAYTTTQADLERLQTQKKIEHIDYLTAKENVERRMLRAPSPGIVTKLIKQTGESAQANEAIVKLCDSSRIMFVANVPAAVGDKLRMDQIVNLQVVNQNNLKAKIVFISPVLDSASGLREMKAELIKPPASIQPGVAAALELSL